MFTILYFFVLLITTFLIAFLELRLNSGISFTISNLLENLGRVFVIRNSFSFPFLNEKFVLELWVILFSYKELAFEELILLFESESEGDSSVSSYDSL